MNARPALGALAGGVAAVLLAAKGLAIAAVPVSPGAGSLLPADDVAIALGVAALAGRAPRWCRLLVIAAVVLVGSLHVAMVRALGRPFLPSMLGGVDAAMADSARQYLTAGNALCAAVLLAAAAGGSWLGRRCKLPRAAAAGIAIAAAVLATLLPPPAHPSHRNPFVAFTRALLPRGAPPPGPVDASDEPRLIGARAGLHGAAAGRSVVIVVLESAAARVVDPADGSATAMPFLRGLAAAGLDCPQAWAVYPESIEGQVPLFCGVPPQPDAAPDAYERHARAALPRRLRPHGYTSALFHAGRFRFLGMHDVIAPMGFDVLADAAQIGGDRESSYGVGEEATVDALLRWLDGLPETQRVLACYLPIAGHHPYCSPAGGPFPTDTQLGCYRNALHYADRALARLWRGLCARRPPEHWLLCVAGDHGQAFGEHPGNFGHVFELYEENLRVPLLFVAPGTALAGRRCELPCSHLDVVPTLLALLGLHDAQSLLLEPPRPRIVHAFADWGELLVAARDERWKLIHDVATGADRLFDLHRDPWERHELARSEPDVAARLRRSALTFLRRAREEAGSAPGSPGLDGCARGPVRVR